MSQYRLISLIVLVFLPVLVYSQYQLEVAFPNLSFNSPVDLQHPGDNSNRLFVVEQEGKIQVFQNDPAVNQKKVFLDIVNKVNSGGEKGLLGLAFHPEFQNNGYFYVDYTASSPLRTVISRFSVSFTNPDSADPNSEFILLEINQPFSNHNGGQISFGPEGYLYIAMGDGGSGGDPYGHGQNTQSLLGALLRIDVDSTTTGLNYAIPPDNPFAGNTQGNKEEIFAYGLRNPWRFSFDPETKWLWCGDVGQGDYEEVDIIENGKNYGWNIMEGFHCFSNPNCDTSGLRMPVWEYGHNSSGGFSITGGFVYRGPSVAGLYGKYVYGDYVTGNIWALEYDGINPPVNNLLMNSSLSISSFGVDQNDEIYICTFQNQIYRFSPTVTSTPDLNEVNPKNYRLKQNFPNPFNENTRIEYQVEEDSSIEVNIFNIQGEFVANLVNSFKPKGHFTLIWNGRNSQNKIQPSGLYFYRLKVNGHYTASRRMLLIK